MLAQAWAYVFAYVGSPLGAYVVAYVFDLPKQIRILNLSISAL